jgi:TonB family protein
MLEKVVAIDPKYKNGWNYLGWTYNAMGQYTKAEAALRKAIEVDAKDPRAYNNLGQALAAQKKYPEAIEQYQKQVEINSKDQWAHANMGRVYIQMKEYEKALTQLAAAASISPNDASIPFNIGRACAKLLQPDCATQAFEKSAELQPVSLRWNAVAYEMANEALDLKAAEKYAQQAIAAQVLQMRDTSLDHVTREDAYAASRIAAYWDTWGWIKYRENDLGEAEKYVKSAWLIRQPGIISEHLGEIYEKQQKTAEATRLYQMAMADDANLTSARERLTALVGAEKVDVRAEEGHGLLRETRTIAVKNAYGVEGFAEYWILLSPGPTVRGVKFVTGDEELKAFEKDLEGVAFPDSFPEATELRLLRRGRLSCTHGAADCKLQLISSVGAGTEEIAATAPSVAGEAGGLTGFRIRIGGNVQAAKLLNRVQPAYPALARQTKVSGVVRMHVIIGKDGKVEQLEVISGHPLLVQSALDAVRQWVYSPTLLEGKPVEVETEIDVTFAFQ